jgi:hypothetical protein
MQDRCDAFRMKFVIIGISLTCSALSASHIRKHFELGLDDTGLQFANWFSMVGWLAVAVVSWRIL